MRSACGFATRHGAVTLTTLFVTPYHFLPPPMAWQYRVPIALPELNSVSTLLQGKWTKILEDGNR